MVVVAEPALAVKSVDAATRAHWEALYIAHHQVVWRTLRRIGFSPDAAAEATQQAFLICVQRFEDVRPGSERAFLFSTAIRVAKTVARKHRRISLEGELEHPDLGVSAEALDRRELAVKILDRVLRQLDEDLVTVFTLFEIEGFSSPEIAEILDIPLGTVASRLRRAREGFRKAARAVELEGRGKASGAVRLQVARNES